jgi:hypothetical protein
MIDEQGLAADGAEGADGRIYTTRQYLSGFSEKPGRFFEIHRCPSIGG